MNCYDYFRRQGRLNPDKTALVCGGRRLSYGELNDETDRLAWGLREAGIGRGTVAAIVMRNSVDMVECLFALWKLGAKAAPLNFRESAENLGLMLDISRAGALVCPSTLAGALLRGREGLTYIASDGEHSGLTLEKLRRSGRVWDAEAVPGGEELLYIFTSGTTGTPKAAVHTGGALAEFSLRCYEFGGLYDPEDVFLNYSPLCHIGGIRILLGNLMCGATLVLASSFEPDEVLSLIERERVTQMFIIPPSMVMRLKNASARGALGSLRRIRVSGGLCTREAAEELFERFGGVTLINGYGSSESAVSTFNEISREAYLKNPTLIKSVGRPLPGCEIRLLGEDGRDIGEPCVAGEAYGRCPYGFKRYQKLTGSEFPGEWFDTGDLLRADAEGNYYFASRKKDIIKSGGENVFAGEVEAVLARHPAVAECAVFKTRHETLGEAVSAAVVLREGWSCTARNLFDFCKANMASYKKPIRYFFVESLPRTASGKVRKAALEELAEKGEL